MIISNVKDAAKQAALLASTKYAQDIAALKVRHKKQITKVKLKQRAKAKIQRGVVAIPILGIGSLAVFETLEFKDWQKDNPNRTLEDYSEELSSEVKILLVDEYGRFNQYSKEIIESISSKSNQL